MTRGNQRDLAREKNMKKQAEHSKAKKADEKDGNKGMSLQDRKQRCIRGEMCHIALQIEFSKATFPDVGKFNTEIAMYSEMLGGLEELYSDADRMREKQKASGEKK